MYNDFDVYYDKLDYSFFVSDGHLFMFTAHRAKRSVDILAFDKQAASTTWQAAWLRNMLLVSAVCALYIYITSITTIMTKT